MFTLPLKLKNQAKSHNKKVIEGWLNMFLREYNFIINNINQKLNII